MATIVNGPGDAATEAAYQEWRTATILAAEAIMGAVTAYSDYTGNDNVAVAIEYVLRKFDESRGY